MSVTGPGFGPPKSVCVSRHTTTASPCGVAATAGAACSAVASPELLMAKDGWRARPSAVMRCARMRPSCSHTTSSVPEPASAMSGSATVLASGVSSAESSGSIGTPEMMRWRNTRAAAGAGPPRPGPGREEPPPARRRRRAARKRAAEVEHGYENGRADHVARRIVAARLDRQLAAVVAAPDDQEVSRRAEGDIGLVVTEVVHLAGGEERTEHLPSGVVALEEYGIAARYLDARTPGDGDRRVRGHREGRERGCERARSRDLLAADRRATRCEALEAHGREGLAGVRAAPGHDEAAGWVRGHAGARLL